MRRRDVFVTAAAAACGLVFSGRGQAAHAVGSLKGKREIARLGGEGFPEVIGWDSVRVGDLILATDWDLDGRMQSQFGWKVESKVYGSEYPGGMALTCKSDFTIFDFWKEALRRQGRTS